MDAFTKCSKPSRRRAPKLLYAENLAYVDGVRAMTMLLREAEPRDKGKILLQQGVCAHQGSHAPAYDTPEKSGGGSLMNKACHPLGPALYLKQVEGILREGAPIRPVKVSAVALQVLKQQSHTSGEHFRVMQNVDDYARVTVLFEDDTVAELTGHDLSISGIRNAFSVIADFGQYDMRINPNDGNELFLPEGEIADNLLMREKLPTAEGTSFPSPRQFHAHGYVNELDDAVRCVLEPERCPQSGPMLAWDTLAVLMAGYESAEKDSRFIDISDYTLGRDFGPRRPRPHACRRSTAAQVSDGVSRAARRRVPLGMALPPGGRKACRDDAHKHEDRRGNCRPLVEVVQRQHNPQSGILHADLNA